MTTLLYQTDSYLKEFDALITEVDQENHGVVFDETAFYPGGGGQPSDEGSITIGEKKYQVLRAKRINSKLVHILESEVELPQVGDHIHGKINWERRYQLMRTHTAMHILCGVVFREYGALVTGGNMEPLKGRMDFEFESMQKELVSKIAGAINLEVNTGRDIKVNILPREEAFQIPDLIRTKINLLPEGIPNVRIVEIEGLDLQADGGTHVRNTSEVGVIRVVNYKSKGKINKRIYVELEDA